MIEFSGTTASQGNTPQESISNGMRIREITPTDDPASLWEIGVRAMRNIDPGYPSTKRKSQADMDDPYKFYKQDHKGEFLIAEIDGKPVGIGGFIEDQESNDPAVCQMRRVRVDPDHQRKGVSENLMKELERIAVGKGYRKSVLTTSNKLTAAVALYKKLGYEIISEKPLGSTNLGEGTTELTMTKNLVDVK